MKKSLFTLIALAAVLFAGCADNKVIAGKEYKPFGLINKDDRKDPSVSYSLSTGNLIWGCVLAETIIAPVYFFGFSLWDPDSLKQAAHTNL